MTILWPPYCEKWISCAVLQQKPLCLHNSSPVMAELDWIIFTRGWKQKAWQGWGWGVCACACMVFVVCFACVFEWMFVLIKHQQLLGPGGRQDFTAIKSGQCFLCHWCWRKLPCFPSLSLHLFSLLTLPPPHPPSVSQLPCSLRLQK